MVATPVVGSATGVVFRLVFSPAPIGTVSTVPAGTNVSVTLTAKDNLGNPVPGGTVFLTFQQAAGGGTAFSGTTGLTPKQKMFTADASGQVAITYSTPPSYPSAGCDVIHAQNALTGTRSTASAHDSFCFSPITALGFTPRPIARKGFLGANSHVTVTLTVFGANGARLANGTVWLAFKKATNGGSATVNAVALSSTAVPETTNAIGQVFIVYSTASVLPTLGADRLLASNSAKNGGTVTLSDAYQY